MSSGAVHTTSDTVALVLLSHDISHLARQSHSKALPRRSLRENKRQEAARQLDKKGNLYVHLQLYERVQVDENISGQELDVVVRQRPAGKSSILLQVN